MPDNVSITHRYLAKSEETVEQSEYKIDIAPTNISLWTVPGLKWFVVDNGKSNKQKCVQHRVKLFLCIHLISFWNEVSVWRQAYKNLLPARREPAGNSFVGGIGAIQHDESRTKTIIARMFPCIGVLLGRVALDRSWFIHFWELMFIN